MKYCFTIVLVMLTFLTSVGNIPNNMPMKMELIKDVCVYNMNTHSAFTSLCEYNGEMYLAFREAHHHRETTDDKGVIKIMKCKGGNWSVVETLRKEGIDLRDPCILAFNGELRIYTANGLYSKLVDGKWSDWYRISHNVSHPITIWKIRQHKNVLYSIGYKKGEWPVLIKSLDGNKWDYVNTIKIGGDATEADLSFCGDTMFACIRINNPLGSNSMWGVGTFPFENIIWTMMDVSISSPELFYDENNGFIILSGREYETNYSRIKSIKVPIYYVNKNGSIKNSMQLETGNNGDKGYPSFCVSGDTLYMSYYTGYKETEIRLSSFRFK